MSKKISFEAKLIFSAAVIVLILATVFVYTSVCEDKDKQEETEFVVTHNGEQ